MNYALFKELKENRSIKVLNLGRERVRSWYLSNHHIDRMKTSWKSYTKGKSILGQRPRKLSPGQWLTKFIALASRKIMLSHPNLFSVVKSRVNFCTSFYTQRSGRKEKTFYLAEKYDCFKETWGWLLKINETNFTWVVEVTFIE